MHGQVEKEVAKLEESSDKLIQKINGDLVKKVLQVFEKLIKQQMEL